MENAPNENPNNPDQSTTVKLKPKKLPTECKICGSPALYSSFGAVVCSSCKIFFRRNAQKNQDHLKCPYDGHCEININTRHICASCRLAKCFASGMQLEMIRAPRTTKNTTSQKTPVTTISTLSTTRKENDPPEQLPTLNLLRNDSSTLTIDEWNLLSNISHCYDGHSGISASEYFLQKQNELPLKMRFKTASVAEFLTSIVSEGQVLYERNADFTSICPHDRSLLLRNTVKYVAAIGSCLIARYTRIFDNPAFYESAEIIYGSRILADSNRTLDLLDCDDLFVKLILALLTFSTFDQTYYTNDASDNLRDIKAILRIQYVYIDLAWRYLIYKCGHERAVICFSNLIKCLFSLNNSLIEAVQHKQYMDMIDSLIKQTEEKFTQPPE